MVHERRQDGVCRGAADAQVRAIWVNDSPRRDSAANGSTTAMTRSVAGTDA